MNNNFNNHRHQKRIKIFMTIVILLIILSFLYWFFLVRGREFTDDAYIHADMAKISSRIFGTINSILVENDDYVKKGDLLLTLDDRELKLEKESLLAVKEQILSALEAEKINLEMIDKTTLADLENAQANLKKAIHIKTQTEKELEGLKKQREETIILLNQAQKDYKRYKDLITNKLISPREFEEKENNLNILQAKLDSIDKKIESFEEVYKQTQSQIRSSRAILEKSKALQLNVQRTKLNIKNLKAKLEEVETKIKKTELYLSYTRITAPISGYIAQKSIQIGEKVQPGEPLLAIVPLDKIYVEANFKETQLTHMYLGQKAIIEPDIYPGLKLEGKVVGIRAGTGTTFSLLPPENAVGNWIKVVQRVPVKILFTEPIPAEYPLRVGLSLEVTVFTSEKTGPRLRSAK